MNFNSLDKPTNLTDPGHRYFNLFELDMDTHSFSGNVPILVFDFLSRIVEKNDGLLMSENKRYILQLHFLTKPTLTQVWTIQAGFCCKGVPC